MQEKTLSKRRETVRKMVECALLVAVAVVIDLLPFPKWPQGGSVSLCMIPIVFCSYRNGAKWGLAAGFVLSCVQMIMGFYVPPANTVWAIILCVLLDYVIAFTALGSADIFAKLCALIRISVPYTGMIISTRESQAVREKVLPLGVSQISGASRTSVGGYAEPEKEEEVTSAQFDVSDNRTLDEVVNWLMKLGYIPSFCTACYREGRTGDRFMALCKNMQIQNCCHPNALMTLKEYLEDYASPETKEIGMKLIEEELENIPNPKVKKTASEYIHDIAEGKRDFRF